MDECQQVTASRAAQVGDTPEANLFGHDMAVGWDGSFEVWIGGEKRGPNWLPTTPRGLPPER